MSTDDQVSVTIDDTTLSVPKGTLVIRAAELIGRKITQHHKGDSLGPAHGDGLGRCLSPFSREWF